MSYDPELYELFHDDHGGDIFFYRRLARASRGPVLELGAGTGRTLLPIARVGVRAVGLERDPRMLAALRARIAREPPHVRSCLEAVEGDMADFDLPERFRLVQIPFRAFLHNTTRATQLSCLRSCYHHLVEGGELALNVFFPSLTVLSESRGSNAGRWRWVDEVAAPGGGWIMLSEAIHYDAVNQQAASRLRYDHFAEDGRLIRSHLQRLDIAYLYPGDLRDLLREAGFSEVKILGGFEGKPLKREEQEIVVRAKRI